MAFFFNCFLSLVVMVRRCGLVGARCQVGRVMGMGNG